MRTVPEDVLHRLFHHVIESSGFIPYPKGGPDPPRHPSTPRDSDETSEESYETETHQTIVTIHRRNGIIVKMASVCRYWRNVSINSGIFWSNIAFNTKRPLTVKLAELFLKRSKRAPLTVHILDSKGRLSTSPPFQHLVRRIAAESGRMTLCVLFSGTPMFWSYWTHPAPDINTLVIGGSSATGVPLFSMELGQLRKFVSFSYLSPSGLQNLTFLKMDNDERAVLLTSLLDMLQSSINLEVLSLGQFKTPSLVIDTPTAPVSLLRVRRVTLADCDSATLLHYINLPSSAGLHIYGQPTTDDMVSVLPGSFGSMEVLRNLDKFSVVYRPNRYCISAGRRGGWNFSIQSSGYTGRRVQASLDAVIRFQPFSTIHYLSFCSYLYLQGWPEQILNLRYLKDLCVEYIQPNQLIDTLNAGTNLPALQVLKSLTFRRCPSFTAVNSEHLKALLESRRLPQLEKITFYGSACAGMQELDVGSTWADLLVLKGTFLLLNPLINAELVIRAGGKNRFTL